MKRMLQFHLVSLALLVSAACVDGPTAPAPNPEGSGPGKITMAPGTPGECNPWQDVNWCDPGDGECIESSPSVQEPEEYVGVQGCNDDTRLGGGGGTPPGEPGDTCNTGDPILDDPQVSVGLRDLWARSNPDANLAQRRETAGWIVRTAQGYSIVPIATTSSSFGCADFVAQPPTTGTVVAFVHTHPYQVDEVIIDCRYQLVQDYTGTPSDADRIASKLLGNLVGTYPLPGYIIDKDGYFRFEGTQYAAAPRFPRCGY